MKKVVLCVIALLFCTVMTLDTMLDVSAYREIVIATSDAGILLSNYIECSYDAKYGDIINISSLDDEIVVFGSFPARFAEPERIELSCVGNVTIDGAYEHKEVTVIDVSNVELILKDDDGIIYKYTSADTALGRNVPTGMSSGDYQVGDTLTVALYVNGSNNRTYVLPLTPAPERTPIKGDVDCNGTVDIMDVILLNRYLMIGAEISEQGMENALCTALNDGAARSASVRQPDAVDALNILKYIVRLVDEL